MSREICRTTHFPGPKEWREIRGELGRIPAAGVIIKPSAEELAAGEFVLEYDIVRLPFVSNIEVSMSRTRFSATCMSDRLPA